LEANSKGKERGWEGRKFGLKGRNFGHPILKNFPKEFKTRELGISWGKNFGWLNFPWHYFTGFQGQEGEAYQGIKRLAPKGWQKTLGRRGGAT